MSEKDKKYTVVEAPEGYSAPGFFATTLDKAVGLARKNSLWPLRNASLAKRLDLY